MKKLLALCFLLLGLTSSYAAPAPITIPSIAALRAGNFGSYATLILSAFYSGGSEGGGILTLAGADSSADNKCTIYVDAAGHRFHRVINNSTLTAEDCGAVGDASTNDAVALNAAALVSIANHWCLQLGSHTYVMTAATWDMTSKNTDSNSGVCVTGQGINNSVIIYKAGTNNTGRGWDTTGAAYVTLRDFSFQGGTAAGNNSPQVTLLQGAACSTATSPCTGSLVFSGLMVFDSVRLVNFQGTRVVANAGAEQISYKNCIAQGITSSVSAVFQFDAGGSAPNYTSAIATTHNPVSSMTQVHWEGARANLLFTGSYGVLFHYTAAGGVADITFDDYVLNNSASGASFLFGDDAAALAATQDTRIGGSRIQYESGGGNAAMAVSSLGAILVNNFHVDGFTGSGTTITTIPVNFTAGITVTNSSVNWHPNVAGSYSGMNLVKGGVGTLFQGITIQAPLAKADILTGGTQTSFIAQGTDGNLSNVGAF